MEGAPRPLPPEALGKKKRPAGKSKIENYGRE